MTKQQKARAHLARAQELLTGQGTLAFGGVSDWSKGTSEREQFDEGSLSTLMSSNTPHHVLVEKARDLNGQELLNFRALGRAYKDAVTTLMQERTRGDQGEKNLRDAFQKADIVMVRLLLQNGARMETLELLRHAISYNIEDLAIKIITTQLSTDSLDTDKIHIDHEIVTDQTVLMYAISHGRYGIAKLLIWGGADVNGKNFRFDGISPAMALKTPLDWACRRVILDTDPDRLPFVEYLLKKKANPRMMGRYRILLGNLTDDPQSDERDLSALLRSYPGNQV